jgi:hypothetical protein
MTHIKNRLATALKYAILVGAFNTLKTICLVQHFVALWNTWHQRCLRMSHMTTPWTSGVSVSFYMNFTTATPLSQAKIRLKFHKKLQNVKFVLAPLANLIIKISSINFSSMTLRDVSL